MHEYMGLLRQVAALPGVKKVFIRSGIRYDYLLLDRSEAFLRQLTANHVSGHLKVAPEHSQPAVLTAMGKPGWAVYRRFAAKFAKQNELLDKKQYLLPYFIAAHPGCTLQEAVQLAVQMKQGGWQPEQVQLFLPSPGSKSTCMYYTGLNPDDMQPVYVPKSREEREMQLALLLYAQPQKQALVRKALQKAGREDLIGWGRQYLVPPEGTPPWRQNKAKIKQKNINSQEKNNKPNKPKGYNKTQRGRR